MGSVNNRRTQFNMRALAGTAKPLPPSTDISRSQRSESPRETNQKPGSSKKRTRLPDEGAFDIKLGTDKVISKLDKPPVAGSLPLRTVWESPWTRYEKTYDRELAGSVAVAVRRVPPNELVHVKKFEKPGAEKALHNFRSLQHGNIVAALEAFTTDHDLYVVLEPMSISLERIVRSPAYPDERQLAAILGQVLNGVSYLMMKGVEHGSLNCSNILMKTDGTLKIASYEYCQVIGRSTGASRDLRALPFITMELMQKYVKEDGAIGVDDLQRWRSSSEAVGFLSAAASAASAQELLKHPLLARPWQKESLIGLVDLGLICLRGQYKYTPPNGALYS